MNMNEWWLLTVKLYFWRHGSFVVVTIVLVEVRIDKSSSGSHMPYPWTGLKGRTDGRTDRWTHYQRKNRQFSSFVDLNCQFVYSPSLADVVSDKLFDSCKLAMRVWAWVRQQSRCTGCHSLSLSFLWWSDWKSKYTCAYPLILNIKYQKPNGIK